MLLSSCGIHWKTWSTERSTKTSSVSVPSSAKAIAWNSAENSVSGQTRLSGNHAGGNAVRCRGERLEGDGQLAVAEPVEQRAEVLAALHEDDARAARASRRTMWMADDGE